MPTYAYRCTTCGNFERFRRMDERDEPAACPHCDRPAGRMPTAARLLPGPGDGMSSAAMEAYPRMRHAGGCECC